MALKTGRGAAAPPFLVMDVIAAANARQAELPPGAPHVIRMEVGQPATGAPAGAVTAAQSALQAGLPMGYTEAFGRPSLRARIARHYGDWYGLDLAPDRVAVTVGAVAVPTVPRNWVRVANVKRIRYSARASVFAKTPAV